jgi:hypothetical protein
VRRNVPLRYGQSASSFGAFEHGSVSQIQTRHYHTYFKNDLEERHITVVHIKIDLWVWIRFERVQLRGKSAVMKRFVEQS